MLRRIVKVRVAHYVAALDRGEDVNTAMATDTLLRFDDACKKAGVSIVPATCGVPSHDVPERGCDEIGDYELREYVVFHKCMDAVNYRIIEHLDDEWKVEEYD